ncbi:unnamed protein product, partial [Closterium sp. Naga37s-1]
YLNNPEATAATITPDGWLRTGDVAYVDGAGEFLIPLLTLSFTPPFCCLSPLGYLNNPEATAATITPDGWLRTGDVAYVDGAGEFLIPLLTLSFTPPFCCLSPLGYLNNPEATAATLTPDGWLRTGDVAYVDGAGEFLIPLLTLSFTPPFCCLSPLGYLNNPEATAATLTPDGWLRTGDVAYVDGAGEFLIPLLTLSFTPPFCCLSPLGYLNNPEATAATITPDGWLRTGDVAYVDGAGEFLIPLLTLSFTPPFCCLSPLGYLNNPEATAATITPDGWLRTGDVAYVDGAGEFLIPLLTLSFTPPFCCLSPLGYLNNPEATAATITPDGWLRTGDVAYVDGAGEFLIPLLTLSFTPPFCCLSPLGYLNNPEATAATLTPDGWLRTGDVAYVDGAGEFLIPLLTLSFTPPFCCLSPLGYLNNPEATAATLTPDGWLRTGDVAYVDGAGEFLIPLLTLSFTPPFCCLSPLGYLNNPEATAATLTPDGWLRTGDVAYVDGAGEFLIPLLTLSFTPPFCCLSPLGYLNNPEATAATITPDGWLRTGDVAYVDGAGEFLIPLLTLSFTPPFCCLSPLGYLNNPEATAATITPDGWLRTGDVAYVDGAGEFLIPLLTLSFTPPFCCLSPLGYLNNPEATAATITPDGWLRTGDVAYVDGEGEFLIPLLTLSFTPPFCCLSPLGYLNNPEATAATITPDGWLRTGDVAYVDGAGEFLIPLLTLSFTPPFCCLSPLGYLNNPEATTATITPDGWLRTGDVAYVDGAGEFLIPLLTLSFTPPFCCLSPLGYLNNPEATAATLTPDGWLRTGDVAYVDGAGEFLIPLLTLSFTPPFCCLSPLGYLNNPEATAATITPDGWLRTGDVAYVDGAGEFLIPLLTLSFTPPFCCLSPLGYLNNPEATAATITPDGWLRTGDVAYVDGAGEFLIPLLTLSFTPPFCCLSPLGYLNNPEATAATITPDGWLRTGDVAYLNNPEATAATITPDGWLRTGDVAYVDGAGEFLIPLLTLSFTPPFCCLSPLGYLNNPEATAATITPDGWLRTGDVAYVDGAGEFLIPLLTLSFTPPFCCLSPLGYLNNPEATAATITPDGWLRTGDVAYVDGAGEFLIPLLTLSFTPPFCCLSPLGYLNKPEATAATITPDGCLRTGDVAYVDGAGEFLIPLLTLSFTPPFCCLSPLGYLNNPEATAATITPDGWLRTGDVAYVDGAGEFLIPLLTLSFTPPFCCLSPLGYLNNPEATAATITPDGWLRTGDVAYVDGAGEFLIPLLTLSFTPPFCCLSPLGYLNNPEATAATLTPDGLLRTGDVAYVDGEGEFLIPLLTLSFTPPFCCLSPLGYLNNPEATAATITPDGWLRTGDVAYVDGAGEFLIPLLTLSFTPPFCCLSPLGYLNNPEATAATLTPDGLLRTGDVAYVDGEGEFLIPLLTLSFTPPFCCLSPLGYLNNPEATAATITPDGWLRTGDVAYVDGAGEFLIPLLTLSFTPPFCCLSPLGYLNNPEATTATITPDGWLRTGDVAYVDGAGEFLIPLLTLSFTPPFCCLSPLGYLNNPEATAATLTPDGLLRTGDVAYVDGAGEFLIPLLTLSFTPPFCCLSPLGYLNNPEATAATITPDGWLRTGDVAYVDGAGEFLIPLLTLSFTPPFCCLSPLGYLNNPEATAATLTPDGLLRTGDVAYVDGAGEFLIPLLTLSFTPPFCCLSPLGYLNNPEATAATLTPDGWLRTGDVAYVDGAGEFLIPLLTLSFTPPFCCLSPLGYLNNPEATAATITPDGWLRTGDVAYVDGAGEFLIPLLTLSFTPPFCCLSPLGYLNNPEATAATLTPDGLLRTGDVAYVDGAGEFLIPLLTLSFTPPFCCLFPLGYLNNPEATAATLTPDGWLRTGDVAYVDGAGEFLIPLLTLSFTPPFCCLSPLGYLNNPEATAATITPDGWLRTGDVAYVDGAGEFLIPLLTLSFTPPFCCLSPLGYLNNPEATAATLTPDGLLRTGDVAYVDGAGEFLIPLLTLSFTPPFCCLSPLGYLNNPEATAATLTPDGWLRTGDVAYVDGAGEFLIPLLTLSFTPPFCCLSPLGYLNNPEATAATITPDGWLRMGDVAYVDGAGEFLIPLLTLSFTPPFCCLSPLGYLNNPEATAATITPDGWLRTGDVAYVDGAGEFLIPLLTLSFTPPFCCLSPLGYLNNPEATAATITPDGWLRTGDVAYVDGAGEFLIPLLTLSFTPPFCCLSPLGYLNNPEATAATLTPDGLLRTGDVAYVDGAGEFLIPLLTLSFTPPFCCLSPLGYLNNPEATAATLTPDGWLRTGDVAYVDGAGEFLIPLLTLSFTPPFCCLSPLGYLNNPEATAATITPDGWLRMGDVAYVDGAGEFLIPLLTLSFTPPFCCLSPLGYLNNPEATAATLTPDGWLRTGDVAYVDGAGEFLIPLLTLSFTPPFCCLSPLGYLKNPEATGATLTPDGWLRTGDVAYVDGAGEFLIPLLTLSFTPPFCCLSPLGYLNNPEATAATLTPDGWLRTGDVAYVDGAGEFLIPLLTLSFTPPFCCLSPLGYLNNPEATAATLTPDGLLRTGDVAYVDGAGEFLIPLLTLSFTPPFCCLSPLGYLNNPEATAATITPDGWLRTGDVAYVDGAGEFLIPLLTLSFTPPFCCLSPLGYLNNPEATAATITPDGWLRTGDVAYVDGAGEFLIPLLTLSFTPPFCCLSPLGYLNNPEATAATITPDGWLRTGDVAYVDGAGEFLIPLLTLSFTPPFCCLSPLGYLNNPEATAATLTPDGLLRTGDVAYVDGAGEFLIPLLTLSFTPPFCCLSPLGYLNNPEATAATLTPDGLLRTGDVAYVDGAGEFLIPLLTLSFTPPFCCLSPLGYLNNPEATAATITPDGWLRTGDVAYVDGAGEFLIPLLTLSFTPPFCCLSPLGYLNNPEATAATITPDGWLRTGDVAYVDGAGEFLIPLLTLSFTPPFCCLSPLGYLNNPEATAATITPDGWLRTGDVAYVDGAGEFLIPLLTLSFTPPFCCLSPLGYLNNPEATAATITPDGWLRTGDVAYVDGAGEFLIPLLTLSFTPPFCCLSPLGYLNNPEATAATLTPDGLLRTGDVAYVDGAGEFLIPLLTLSFTPPFCCLSPLGYLNNPEATAATLTPDGWLRTGDVAYVDGAGEFLIPLLTLSFTPPFCCLSPLGYLNNPEATAATITPDGWLRTGDVAYVDGAGEFLIPLLTLSFTPPFCCLSPLGYLNNPEATAATLTPDGWLRTGDVAYVDGAGEFLIPLLTLSFTPPFCCLSPLGYLNNPEATAATITPDGLLRTGDVAYVDGAGEFLIPLLTLSFTPPFCCLSPLGYLNNPEATAATLTPDGLLRTGDVAYVDGAGEFLIPLLTLSFTPPFCCLSPLGYLNNPEATAATITPGGWLRTGDVAYVDGAGEFLIPLLTLSFTPPFCCLSPLGYLNNPEATAATLTPDGWLRTGDVAYVDGAGEFLIPLLTLSFTPPFCCLSPLGYLNNPEATAATITPDGWLRTGDVAYVDGAGEFLIPLLTLSFTPPFCCLSPLGYLNNPEATAATITPDGLLRTGDVAYVDGAGEFLIPLLTLSFTPPFCCLSPLGYLNNPEATAATLTPDGLLRTGDVAYVDGAGEFLIPLLTLSFTPPFCCLSPLGYLNNPEATAATLTPDGLLRTGDVAYVDGAGEFLIPLLTLSFTPPFCCLSPLGYLNNPEATAATLTPDGLLRTGDVAYVDGAGEFLIPLLTLSFTPPFCCLSPLGYLNNPEATAATLTPDGLLRTGDVAYVDGAGEFLIPLLTLSFTPPFCCLSPLGYLNNPEATAATITPDGWLRTGDVAYVDGAGEFLIPLLTLSFTPPFCCLSPLGYLNNPEATAATLTPDGLLRTGDVAYVDGAGEFLIPLLTLSFTPPFCCLSPLGYLNNPEATAATLTPDGLLRTGDVAYVDGAGEFLIPLLTLSFTPPFCCLSPLGYLNNPEATAATLTPDGLLRTGDVAYVDGAGEFLIPLLTLSFTPPFCCLSPLGYLNNPEATAATLTPDGLLRTGDVAYVDGAGEFLIPLLTLSFTPPFCCLSPLGYLNNPEATAATLTPDGLLRTGDVAYVDGAGEFLIPLLTLSFTPPFCCLSPLGYLNNPEATAATLTPDGLLRTGDVAYVDGAGEFLIPLLTLSFTPPFCCLSPLGYLNNPEATAATLTPDGLLRTGDVAYVDGAGEFLIPLLTLSFTPPFCCLSPLGYLNNPEATAATLTPDGLLRTGDVAYVDGAGEFLIPLLTLSFTPPFCCLSPLGYLNNPEATAATLTPDGLLRTGDVAYVDGAGEFLIPLLTLSFTPPFCCLSPLGYLNNPEATAATITPDGWLRTGDVAYVDGAGEFLIPLLTLSFTPPFCCLSPLGYLNNPEATAATLTPDGLLRTGDVAYVDGAGEFLIPLLTLSFTPPFCCLSPLGYLNNPEATAATLTPDGLLRTGDVAYVDGAGEFLIPLLTLSFTPPFCCLSPLGYLNNPEATAATLTPDGLLRTGDVAYVDGAGEFLIPLLTLSFTPPFCCLSPLGYLNNPEATAATLTPDGLLRTGDVAYVDGAGEFLIPLLTLSFTPPFCCLSPLGYLNNPEATAATLTPDGLLRTGDVAYVDGAGEFLIPLLTLSFTPPFCCLSPLGYLNNPEATAATLTPDGLLRTGDVAYVDGAGEFLIPLLTLSFTPPFCCLSPLGYLNNPEATAATLTPDGLLRTGDVAYVDGAGEFLIPLLTLSFTPPFCCLSPLGYLNNPEATAATLTPDGLLRTGDVAYVDGAGEFLIPLLTLSFTPPFCCLSPLGYLNNPEATAATLTPDGWLRTGDVAYVDGAGEFLIPLLTLSFTPPFCCLSPLGYLNNPEATAATITPDGWLRMGDVAYVDGAGEFLIPLLTLSFTPPFCCLSPLGYLNNPEATAATITPDGWLRTGDVAYVDGAGEFLIPLLTLSFTPPFCCLSPLGYLNNPEATAATITPDGWLRTGDVAYVDGAGEFLIPLLTLSFTPPFCCLSPLGYLNNPEATAATITPDGWLRTGDVAYVDGAGEFLIPLLTLSFTPPFCCLSPLGYLNNPEATAATLTPDGLLRTGDVAYVDGAGEFLIPLLTLSFTPPFCCLSPLGYLNNPEATAATITPDGWLRTGDVAYVDGATSATITPDGWLRTGDVAYVDKMGEIFVVDRVKELIKVKGFQVPPAELEGLLIAHPDIADAAVVPAVLNLTDPVVFTLLDARGVAVCKTSLSVPSVVEKGFRDDMLPWSNGGQVHVKSNFMLSDEERAKIAAMRARSMSKRKDGSSSGTVTPIASGTVTPRTVSAVLASPVASAAPAASEASTATEIAAASTTELTAATTTTTTTTTVTTSTTATTEAAAVGTVTASTATSTVLAAAQKESAAVTTAVAASAAAGVPVDMSNMMLVFDGSDDESGYTESSLEESFSAQVAPAAPVAAAPVPAAASPVVPTAVPDSVPEVAAASVSQAAQVVQVQGPDSIAPATVEVVKEVQKEVQVTSAQQTASATTTKTDVTIIKTATQVASEATTMTSAKVASVSTSTKAAASAAAASAGASVQAAMSSTTGRASEQSSVRGGGGVAADLNGRVGSSKQPAVADSEAAESSWESGDEVESMEGSSLSGMTDRQVVKRGRGASGKGRNRNGGLLGQVLRVGDGLTPVMKQVLGTGAFMLAMVALWPRPQKQSRVQLETDADGKVWVVKPGETLSSILPREVYCNPSSKFFELNPEVCDINRIYSGQRLVLP